MSEDIHIANPILGDEELTRIESVVESGMIADGPEVREFEAEFTEYCGADHGVATSNGTTALHTALEAVGVGPGDRVLTTPFSFVATANAIRFTGAEPVFADIDPDTFNVDPDHVEETLESLDGDVEAMVVVHLYGLPAPMDRLRTIADEYDVTIVEDAAQAHGAMYFDTPVGSLGDVASFSFYPTKNMTTGEGGMVTTDDEDIAARAASFINHGRESDGYRHVSLGHNFRMTSIAAAMGRSQLDRLPGFVEARRENAARLDEFLAETAAVTPTVPDGYQHSYHQYTIRVDNRDSVTEQLDEYGVGYGIYYPRCIHNQPAYDDVDASVPVAEQVSEQALSIPVHPALSTDQIERVGTVLRDEVTITPPADASRSTMEVTND
ncbi:DegT/DnrJ/EryC1/StrS family aminotransferase (plasmid) [Haloferax mediterranei ATCC 33500]|uniref:Aminotransferase DegT n=1 Tax=Haloferax mediterranei (strain ATCC 33500 / DSM 1411 / JCM 8866 / NBRC 14739 / NCIMB 2177 / R-4) TaxID=523841 RepID=I3RAL4_HALMT|nr:DegT/DnrJ/EryC1/StrS family aminotransferase [Haloferax mediterranei]AFK21274.1 pleiotropic regulatory protein DegT [Haloferax mediterranei ATCC 33500]AHZ24627.1 aminotransferase DegT [Haloferax mediterranei ATCC 33500]ELZ97394.1 pleiotropic regulatory protein DegT [Haloferax mediterranei ATCC 33500]MDX5990310.1 DegT/DnrJ/EryC1/StrS family aminotransferase [Haloferax mediterranei ATCC 33500]QCQ77024.1 DegT/DnrJ/EryC1/StrS family aminotransferase [Haloferax mediterranei ATCC 33500]